MSQLVTSRGHSIGASTSASVLLMNIKDCFPLRLTGVPQLIGRLSLPQHHCSKALILWHSAYGPTLTSIHDYWKNHSFDLCRQSNVSAF